MTNQQANRGNVKTSVPEINVSRHSTIKLCGWKITISSSAKKFVLAATF